MKTRDKILASAEDNKETSSFLSPDYPFKFIPEVF